MKFLQEIMKLREEAEKVELTTFKEKSIPHSAWTRGLEYKGMNVFDAVYDKPEGDIKNVESELKSEYSEFDLDIQECFLGYSPAKDEFVMGFDGWITEENPDYDPDDEEGEGETIDGKCSPYAIFKIDDSGKTKLIKLGMDMGGARVMWYGRKGKSGGYDAVHEMFPDMIDIRLD